MIIKAIEKVDTRGGTSHNSITTFIKSRYLVKDNSYKKYITSKLKEMVEDGRLKKNWFKSL